MSIASTYRRTAFGLAVAGAIGLTAAFVLTVEKVNLLADPAYVPSCSINPVLSCGSVMSTWQAAVFGFPNSLLGICGFTVVSLTGVLVASGVDLPGWYRRGLWIGCCAATVFVHWLIIQSLYRIGALCPYCMVVWFATVVCLSGATNLAFATTTSRLVATIVGWRWTFVAVWVALIVLACYLRFDTYWNSLL